VVKKSAGAWPVLEVHEKNLIALTLPVNQNTVLGAVLRDVPNRSFRDQIEALALELCEADITAP
jgi:hypothetical protein